jgi:orotate phosphoribosyltransferase
VKAEDVMAIFRDTQALLRGHFELRSGLHSDQYFQCAMVLRYPRIAERLCAELTARMRAALGRDFKPAAVIAPAMGGLFVGHEVARALDTESIFAEKQEGKLILRRGFVIGPGRSYVVAEDVITRGGRVQETIDIVTGAGGAVAAVAVIVDRSGGKVRFPYPTFSLLQMEPVAYEPARCPLCAQGVPAVHPGS